MTIKEQLPPSVKEEIKSDKVDIVFRVIITIAVIITLWFVIGIINFASHPICCQ